MKQLLTIAAAIVVVFPANVDLATAQSSSSQSTPKRIVNPMVKDTPAESNGSAAKTNSKSNDSSFALFELFTSEGCSSCPPADANLTRLNELAKQNKRIYTLSYHVDYWNNLGWKDPYSSEAFSNRQRRYARNFDSDRIYTPQMVINGSAEFNGSAQKTSDKAIEIAMRYKPEADLNLRATSDRKSVSVSWEAGNVKGTDTIHVALVQNEGRQSVTRGENANRDLRHVNIVRGMKSTSASQATGKTNIQVPDDFAAKNFHVIGFVQSADGEIKNVAKAQLKK